MSEIVSGAVPMKIGQIEYRASKLTDLDTADLDEYIKAKYLARSQKAANELRPSEGSVLVQNALNEIHDPSTDVCWGGDKGWAILATVDGTLHLGYQMILARHPNVNYSDFYNEARKDPTSALKEIDRVFKYFYPPLNQADVGGSAAENTKSQEAA